jgi:hypothetical protein
VTLETPTPANPTPPNARAGTRPAATVRRAITAGAVCAGLVVVGTGPALAASPAAGAASATTLTCSTAQLSFVQQHVHAAVTRREATITTLTGLLAGRPHVTDAHRATLDGLYASDAPGLRAVDAKVQADTTCLAAVTDGRTVVTSFRVYLLLVPQTRLVSASDTGTWAAGRMAAAEPAAQAAVNAMTDPNRKAAAQARLDALTSDVAAAQSAYSGVADGALALVPADIPAAESTLDGYRTKVAQGNADLRRAVADAKALRALVG